MKACSSRIAHIVVPAALATVVLVQCAPDPEITAGDGAVMILIPAGEFTMGRAGDELERYPKKGYRNYEAERPDRRVAIAAFYLDRTEVTNALYSGFVNEVASEGDGDYRHPDQTEASGHQPELMTEHLNGEQQPVVGVSWYDAYAYCRWAGKRLPSEAEWEYAARGGDPYRIYPWGSGGPDGDGIWWANYHPKSGRGSDGHRASAPVGSYPDGVSPFGLIDMAGNVEEWVQDWYKGTHEKQTETVQNPTGPAKGKLKVIKGGSYEADRWHIRVATRFYGKPDGKSRQLGFRCARHS